MSPHQKQTSVRLAKIYAEADLILIRFAGIFHLFFHYFFPGLYIGPLYDVSCTFALDRLCLLRNINSPPTRKVQIIGHFNRLIPKVPFLYPLKTSECLNFIFVTPSGRKRK